MLTLLYYLAVMVVVVAVLFAVVWFFFGRGEDLPPLERGTTVTTLPSSGITGDDVRALQFAQSMRGYRADDVDWALEKLGREIDELRSVVVRLNERDMRLHEAAESAAATPSNSPLEVADDRPD